MGQLRQAGMSIWKILQGAVLHTEATAKLGLGTELPGVMLWALFV